MILYDIVIKDNTSEKMITFQILNFINKIGTTPYAGVDVTD